MKMKISLSIEKDAFEMLKMAAENEGISKSAMAEKSVRFLCSDYFPHHVEINILENNLWSIHIERRGRRIYSNRKIPRHTTMPIKGSIHFDVPGPIETTHLASLLRNHKIKAVESVKSGKPLKFCKNKIEIMITDFPIAADRNPNYIYDLLRVGTAAISGLETTSLREIMKRKCPDCDVPFVALSIWSPMDKPEEVEWTCGVGHRIQADGRAR